MTSGWLPKDLTPRLKTLRQDIASIRDFETHLTNKLQFLLDATLGFINIAQNNVMKVLAVASVIGIPPVAIAGIYGMNFKIHAGAGMDLRLCLWIGLDRHHHGDSAGDSAREEVDLKASVAQPWKHRPGKRGSDRQSQSHR